MNTVPEQQLHLPAGRAIAILGSGVTERWFKNIWLGQRGTVNPVMCFVDDAPILYFRAGVDGIAVVPEERFFAEYADRGMPFLFIGGGPRLQERVELLMKRGLQPLRDFAQFPDPPDYTIDWLAFYPGWDEAAKDTAGYEDPTNIDEHVRTAKESLAKPRTPEVTYADQRLLTPLGVIFSKIPGAVRVVDFGGALGAHYHRVKHFYPHRALDWWVAETTSMARAGTAHMATAELKFTDDATAVPGPVDVVLASSSLHYVPDSIHFYNLLAELKPRYFLIDRTPLTPWPEDRVMVQRVYRNSSNRKFETSYPVRFLSDDRWIERFQQKFTIAMRWPDTHDIIEIAGDRIVFSGLLLERK